MKITQRMISLLLLVQLAGGILAAQDTLTIEARDDMPAFSGGGSGVELGVTYYDAPGGTVLGSNTLYWDQNDNGWRSLPASPIDLPTGTATIRLEFHNDYWDGGTDPDQDRNAHIDFLIISGITREGEDWQRAGGAEVEVVDGRDCAGLRHSNDWAEYDLDPCTVAASATFRNDSIDWNPQGFSTEPPVLGDQWTCTVDNNVVLGLHNLAAVVAYENDFEYFLADPRVLGFLLVDSSGYELLNAPLQVGTGVVTWDFDVPSDQSLCGFPFSVQGFGFTQVTGQAFKLTLYNAYDCVIGV